MRKTLGLAALFAAFVVLASRNALVFPGLHGDEGWIGLYALRVLSGGIYSAHEMNTYTGPGYGWLLAQSFRLLDPGLLALRLPGLLLNFLAAGLMTWHLGRRFGRRAAAVWLSLLCGSALFLLKTRVAWEVYALQPLILCATAALLPRLLQTRPSSAAVLGFLYLNFLGIQNHFIFLSIPLSLFVAALANDALLSDKRPAFLRLCAVNMLMAAGVYLAKPQITDAFWAAHRGPLMAGFLSWPALCALIFRFWPGRSLEKLAAAIPLKASRAALGLGLGLFFVYHWIALVQIWSGVAVFQRLASWSPPLWLAVPLYAWASVLLGAYFVHALSRFSPAKADALAAHERLLIFWPLAYAALFILFRNTSSIRYYVLPTLLFFFALSIILARQSSRRLALLGLGALIVYGCAWRETSGPPTRKPIRFYIAWHLEKSIDFCDKSAVDRFARENRICDFDRKDSFTDMPLIFLAAGREPGSCDPSKALWTEYCLDCPAPPFVRWKVLKR